MAEDAVSALFEGPNTNSNSSSTHATGPQLLALSRAAATNPRETAVCLARGLASSAEPFRMRAIESKNVPRPAHRATAAEADRASRLLQGIVHLMTSSTEPSVMRDALHAAKVAPIVSLLEHGGGPDDALRGATPFEKMRERAVEAGRLLFGYDSTAAATAAAGADTPVELERSGGAVQEQLPSDVDALVDNADEQVSFTLDALIVQGGTTSAMAQVVAAVRSGHVCGIHLVHLLCVKVCSGQGSLSSRLLCLDLLEFLCKQEALLFQSNHRLSEGAFSSIFADGSCRSDSSTGVKTLRSEIPASLQQLAQNISVPEPLRRRVNAAYSSIETAVRLVETQQSGDAS